MSRHATRQLLAREFDATAIATERGDAGIARIMDLTKGIGADSVLECVETQAAMLQAIRSTRKGGSVLSVGVPHGVELNGENLFFAHVHLHGATAWRRTSHRRRWISRSSVRRGCRGPTVRRWP